MSGGAPLDLELGRKWELLGVKILQGYGATEASPVISNHTMDVRRHDSTGRPLPNVQVKISDQGEILSKGREHHPRLLQRSRCDGESLRRWLVQDRRPRFL